jgi:signal transduction histidine kinase
MDEVVSLFAAKIRTNEVEVRKELEADPPIEAFPGELRQVFSNLVANALDAVGKKGRLHIRIRPVRSVRNHSQKGVRLTVADNGPGISRIDQLRIFEPFFTTKGAKGTGLGLWVTRGIVEKHGGTISVRSSTNKGVSGTAFSVFLPLKQKAEAIRRRALSQVS